MDIQGNQLTQVDLEGYVYVLRVVSLVVVVTRFPGWCDAHCIFDALWSRD